MLKGRFYRNWVQAGDLVSFEARQAQTDLFILAGKELSGQALESISTHRGELEQYIRKEPAFRSSLEPIDVTEEAPPIVKVMADASRKAGVGPMAAVAGAMAEFVGRDLLAFTDQIIVENGGDIFLVTSKSRTLGIYAGEKSPFTGKLAVEIGPAENGIGVCTSSGTVSHSLSFGRADAALIVSKDTALADAAATATGNIVKRPSDIEKGIEFAKSVDGVKAVLILIGNKMGSWGEIKLV